MTDKRPVETAVGRQGYMDMWLGYVTVKEATGSEFSWLVRDDGDDSNSPPCYLPRDVWELLEGYRVVDGRYGVTWKRGWTSLEAAMDALSAAYAMAGLLKTPRE